MNESRTNESRQVTVLRSLFKTLHPLLESGLRPARRLFTGGQPVAVDDQAKELSATEPATASTTGSNHPAGSAQPPKSAPKANPTLANRTVAMDRTFTDEHLITELDNITRQYETPSAPKAPNRSRRHYSRDTLMSLLEEAKVRIQVLETELELARGSDEHIPLLTEEWSDDLPSTFARKPDA